MDESKKTTVLFSNEAIDGMKVGLDIAARAVGCTMGPKGKCVIIQRNDEQPIVTKDGVTVSKSLNLKDPVQRIGANLVKEAAHRTNEAAGDGTTTATVLTHALTTEGLRAIANNHDKIVVKNSMQKGVKLILDELKRIARPVAEKKETVQIGTISANNDSVIGEMIADAMEKVGRDGVVTVEEATGMTTTLDVVEGMQIERGYISPMFATNNEKMNVTYTDCYVFVTDKKLTSVRDIITLLEGVSRAGKPLLIIADDIEGDALHALIVNKLQGALKVVAIKAPGFGMLRDEMLNDICSLTGAKFVSSKTGYSLEKTTVSELGKAKKIVVDARSTLIVGTGDTVEAVEGRANELRAQMENVKLTDEERMQVKYRLAKLSSGVAIIRVGGSTEIEMKERKYRIEDALSATQSAIDEGIIPGGGLALFHARDVLDYVISNPSTTKDQLAGYKAVKNACLAPLKQICHNSGVDSETVIEQLITVKDNPTWGWDAGKEEFADMYEQGIIDPLKVCRIALENACSVAATFLTLDAVVIDE